MTEMGDHILDLDEESSFDVSSKRTTSGTCMRCWEGNAGAGKNRMHLGVFGDYEAYESEPSGGGLGGASGPARMAPPKESSAMTASRYSNGYSSDQQSDSNDEAASNNHGPAYLVEHLATFR
ncbi:epidermal growth factor receptor kinase substrate 8-like [Tropilaelaps mercedesae]|uniref:Epidermal growth factor receptor kinase substrate 8-like n=1 Tax=Tropilaelaps mercedesae TaxID=418985 RepID=A0A1V9XW17_9ACAR|nr:epidermal growth factor receptor kinase substrate 8-like [Tropilaelaps mercedesae]